MTEAQAGGALGDGDMPVNNYEDWNQFDVGIPDFNPATGSAVEANGHQVTFNLYMGVNDRNEMESIIVRLWSSPVYATP